MFINFVVEKFLESEKERVSSFLLSLEDNLVSDEKVAIMEANVKAFSHRMCQCPDLAGEMMSLAGEMMSLCFGSLQDHHHSPLP